MDFSRMQASRKQNGYSEAFSTAIQQHVNKDRLNEHWWKHKFSNNKLHRLRTDEQHKNRSCYWQGTKLCRENKWNMDMREERPENTKTQMLLVCFRIGQGFPLQTHDGDFPSLLAQKTKK
eukprot:13938993-Heterocapsa_arctica.AAC.1